MPILNWLNKEQALTTARDCPYRLLESVPELSYGESNTDNMLIQGDNLDALKALIPTHSGKVKCIFIDPPYNTKSAFEHYDDNLEHSKWLSMMYPRLELLHHLLSEDGCIWITLDDSEAHYFKIIADEIFGRRNFVTTFIWRKVDSPNDNKVAITPDHDYVICYAKNIQQLEFKKKSDSSILVAYNEPDENSDRPYRDRLLKKNGKSSLRTDRPSMYFPIKDPDGNDVYPIHDDGREARWAKGLITVGNLIKKEELVWKKRKDKWIPYTREYAPEDPTRPWPTIWNDLDTTRQTKSHLNKLLGYESIFDTPKPEDLVARTISMTTKPDDLILDSFLGSGTTAAVAMKMNRKFIGIELGDHAVTHCQPRLTEVVDGEQGGISEDVNWTGGSGFKFYRLGEVIFNENGSLREGISFDSLAAHIWYGDTRQALQQSTKSPLLGVHNGIAYYLLYNGILGDKRSNGGNVLTSKVLSILPPHPEDPEKGKKVIYGETSRMGEARLKSENIIFKQIPYDVKGR